MIKKRALQALVMMVMLLCIGQGGLAQNHVLSFPLGLMGPSVDNEPPDLGTVPQKMADVAAGGFNVVYEFRGVQEIADAQTYLNQAQAAGLKVIQNLPVCRAYESDRQVCQEYPVDVWTEQEWATFISTLATYNNLVAWFLPDEIDNYEAAANLYQWVHTYDPLDRPVYANPGSFEQSDINQFPAFTDFLWGISYPELFDEPRALTTHMMKMDALACEGTDTRWGAILQFFDSAQFPYYGRTGHPTAQELRSDSYQAIIGGAKGLWFFSYEMGRGDSLDDLWAEMSTIADEIIGSGGLDEVILTPDVTQGVAMNILSGPAQSPPTREQVYGSIQFLQKWLEGDGTYILAANIATDTVEVEFANLWAEVDTVQVLFEDRTIPIVGDAFSDTFTQDQVHIYYYGAPEPALPVADLSIAGADLPDPAIVGRPLTYTITVTNNGPSPATSVVVSDQLPAGIQPGSIISSQGSCSGTGTVTCALGTIASGDIVTVTIVVTPTIVGTINNTMSVAGQELDPSMANNTATGGTAVYAVIYVPAVFKDL